MSRSVSVPCNAQWRFYLHTQFEIQEDWDDFIWFFRRSLKRRYPSLEDCDTWLDREDHAILENSHACIGVSEYCGLVSVWCVAKEGEGYWSGNDETGLHTRWCSQVWAGVGNLLNKNYPDNLLVHQGTFSNGEAVFMPANRPGGCVTSKEGVLW